MKIETIDFNHPPQPQSPMAEKTREHPAFDCAKPETISHKSPRAAVNPSPEGHGSGGAFVALLVALLLLCGGRAQAFTTIAVANNLSVPLTFALYSTNAASPLGFYTLTGQTTIATGAVASVTGTNTGYAGILEINTNNNYCYIVSNGFTLVGTGTNASYMLTNGWAQQIRIAPPAVQAITNGAAFTNNQI